MQIPVWLFLTSLLLTLAGKDMATQLLNRAFPTSARAFANVKATSFLSHSFNLFSNKQHLTSQQSHPFTTTSNRMASKQFLETIKNRRSFYALKKESTISDKQIQEIIRQAVLHVPSPFNSQSARVILLVKEEHNKLWEITKEVLKGIVPAEAYKATEAKLNGFKAGYGTVSPPSSLALLQPKLTFLFSTGSLLRASPHHRQLPR